MPAPKTTLAIFALCALAGPSAAQAGEVPAGVSFRPIAPVKQMAYDLASRKVVRYRAPRKRAIATFCYVNTDTAGFFAPPRVGSEFIDWGSLGGVATTQCLGLSDIVTSFHFAYATWSRDTSVGGPGAALTLSFYTGWQGFGADSGNCPVASFAFTGLPGTSGSSTGAGSAYAFAVDVSGGAEFCMPDGQFGYGYRGDGRTGPIACFTGNGVGGAEPNTGNWDVFELWQPDTKGVYAGLFYGGLARNYASWYGQIARADLSGTPAAIATRNGGGNPPNSLLCSGGVLGRSLSIEVVAPPGYLVAIAFAFDSPLVLTLGGGQTLLCLDLGSHGELLTGAGLALPAIGGNRFAETVSVPKNVDFCGFSLCLQAICALGVTPFALTSACDVTLGG